MAKLRKVQIEIEGKWHDRGYDTKSSGGRFLRQDARFRNWVTPDGAPGPSGEGGFAAEPGRYHLYVSYACPWAHRAIIVRRIKGLDDVVGMSVVDPWRDDKGWRFTGGEHRDALHGWEYLSQAYEATDPSFEGRVTVPVLWDRHEERIVNNESADVIRMLDEGVDSQFISAWLDRTDARPGELTPDDLIALSNAEAPKELINKLMEMAPETPKAAPPAPAPPPAEPPAATSLFASM